MAPSFVLHNALSRGQLGFDCWALTEQGFRIGRSPECDISLPDLGNISWIHATVDIENGHAILRDHGSTNGTFVNGLSVVEVVLRNDDQIKIGLGHSLFFASGAEAAAVI